MRAKFTTDSMGRVTLAYDEQQFDGETRRIERTFTCPIDGGYVRELAADGSARQVCDRLAYMGNTLAASSLDDLIHLIRHEYKAMRRAEQRAAR